MNDLSVLIVDDDPAIAQFIRMRLLRETPGLKISVVESGQECLGHLETKRVDCILSDYQMPDMNGMELLLSLRSRGNDIPFIFLTGQGNEEVAREAFKNGAYDYFTKEIGFAHFPRIINSIEQAVRQRRADEAKKEELIFRQAIENSVLSGIVGVDTEGRQNYVNPAFCRMVGWSEEELIGALPPFVYWPPEEMGRINDYFKSTIKGEMQSRALEVKFMRKSGERFYVLMLISAIKDSQGKVKGWIGAVYDITERKRTEGSLSESEAMFRDLAEEALAGVYLIQGGRFVYLNQKAAQILGYPKEDLLRLENVLDNVHPEDQAIVRENIRKRLAGEVRTMDYEFRIVRKDGSVAFIEVLGSYTMYKGTPALIGTVIDVTGRKRAEEALKESEAMFRSLSEEALVGIFLIQDGRFVYVNPCFADIAGYSAAELERMDDWLETLVPEERQTARENAAKILSGGGSLHHQGRARRKDGSVIYVECTSAYTTYKGRPALIGTTVEVTERVKAAEEAFRKLKTGSRGLAG